ncbi:beta-glucan synthesis-associated protein (SKN1)-domain containing protein [Nitzschia inconspicua]|uniref:Beta-glucan synthesis-associated protein (SKN1)-domain containing protein n=1 Tax=Nitzschia inconspicua TaxID=303405 RepID=A0A9K3KEA3_9STRA|nr:beta-glucan synthesis-associated protein (SKN1)-domain containing protein [Nitzschia inconspicua]
MHVCSHICSIVLVATLSILTWDTAIAGWIDPDTPEEERFTQPFTVIPGPIPKTDEKNKKKVGSNRTKHHWTPAPTISPVPSNSPTTVPSAYPTSTPGTYELVFSEEFNVPHRTFEDGSDPKWTALEKNDYTNDALHYYAAANAVTDENGRLVITTEAVDTEVVGFNDMKQKKERVTKHFRSAMLQTWNKFCFTGGIIEAKVQLPGNPNIGGLWPAFWLLGNLARHTYVGSSEHIWPFSSNVCTERSFESQHISACSEVAHFGLFKGMGRGSPEIDIFEAQPGSIKANTGPFLRSPVGQPFASASFQVAPGRPTMRPGPTYWPGPGQWYSGLVGGKNTSLNINFYGSYNHFVGDPHPEKSDYWSDAISFNRQLEPRHFNSSHVYRLEWDVPTDEKDGYLHWFLDGELVLAINGTGIRHAGTGAEISTEPSYILMNTAVSSQWGFPLECPDNCKCKQYDCHSNDYAQRCGFPDGFCEMMTQRDSPQYKIDWVRVYQDPNKPEQKVGCSTPERPTRRYIEAHEKLYKTENDERPLKPIQVGRGACDPRAEGILPESCGGEERGTCTKGKVCECKKGWVGPHCMAADGFDDIVWDQPDKLSDVGFVPPSFIATGLIIGLSILALTLVVTMRWRRQLEGWKPIPDVPQ